MAKSDIEHIAKLRRTFFEVDRSSIQAAVHSEMKKNIAQIFVALRAARYSLEDTQEIIYGVFLKFAEEDNELSEFLKDLDGKPFPSEEDNQTR